MKTNVGFIGFGLIAGSLAHALKESGRDYHITATSRHLEPVIAAVADTCITRKVIWTNVSTILIRLST